MTARSAEKFPEEARNFYDELYGLPDPEEQAKQQAAMQASGEHLDHLIHRAFAQSDSGRELLSLWEDALLLYPTVTAESTQFGAGIEEGKKTFIRSIIRTIDRVNKDG